MSIIGIYFGLKTIAVVEVSGKKIVNSLMIPRSAVGGGAVEDKVPEEIKIVALLKEEMRKHAIMAKEAVLCLSGKDLIVRNFEIPVLPADELAAAVGFEAKKYLPFKMEELCYDFQLQMDKVSRRNLVLFVGIKKESMDRYLSIVSQLGLKATAIEYAGFSILRFMYLTGSNTRGITGIISVDFQDEDEVHFTILENGFPLFSRDITLMGRPEEFAGPQAPAPSNQMDKLKTEIRISLDYYDRKLPTKNIEKAFLVCPQELRMPLEAAMKEVTLPVHFLESSKFIGRQAAFNLSLIKGYGCAINKSIKMPLKVDLLAARTRAAKEATEGVQALSFLKGLKISPWSIVAGLLIIGAAFAYGKSRLAPLQGQINTLIAARPQIPNLNTAASSGELEGIGSDYRQRIDLTRSVIQKEIRLTAQLDAMARALPDGVWLTSYNFRNDGARLDVALSGAAVGASEQAEMTMVNDFHSALRKDAVFSRLFNVIEVTSVQRAAFTTEVTGTTFAFVCRGDVKQEGGAPHGT